MTNKEYQELVEMNFNKPLYEIMYELCVIKNVVPVEGAGILGVPKQTFNQWRNKYRLGPQQRAYDQALEIRKKSIEKYQRQLNGLDIERGFDFNEEYSLRGLKEVLERFLELYKLQRAANTAVVDEFSVILRIGTIEQLLSYVDEYQNGKLYEKFEREVQFIKRIISNGDLKQAGS